MAEWMMSHVEPSREPSRATPGEPSSYVTVAARSRACGICADERLFEQLVPAHGSFHHPGDLAEWVCADCGSAFFGEPTQDAPPEPADQPGSRPGASHRDHHAA